MINLYSWYAAPQPGTLPHEPWTVVFWGRRRADHSPSSSSASTQRAPLENYTIIQRTSETTFDSTATKVRLVGPADSRRATQAGVPTEFVNAFATVIPPAWSILSAVAPTLCTVTPSSIMPPNTSPRALTPVHAPAPSPPPLELDSDDEMLPDSLFDMGTGYKRPEGGVKTLKQLVAVLRAPRVPLEGEDDRPYVDRDAGYDPDAVVDEEEDDDDSDEEEEKTTKRPPKDLARALKTVEMEVEASEQEKKIVGQLPVDRELPVDASAEQSAPNYPAPNPPPSIAPPTTSLAPLSSLENDTPTIDIQLSPTEVEKTDTVIAATSSKEPLVPSPPADEIELEATIVQGTEDVEVEEEEQKGVESERDPVVERMEDLPEDEPDDPTLQAPLAPLKDAPAPVPPPIAAASSSITLTTTTATSPIISRDSTPPLIPSNNDDITPLMDSPQMYGRLSDLLLSHGSGGSEVDPDECGELIEFIERDGEGSGADWGVMREVGGGLESVEEEKVDAMEEDGTEVEVEVVDGKEEESGETETKQGGEEEARVDLEVVVEETLLAVEDAEEGKIAEEEGREVSTQVEVPEATIEEIEQEQEQEEGSPDTSLTAVDVASPKDEEETVPEELVENVVEESVAQVEVRERDIVEDGSASRELVVAEEEDTPVIQDLEMLPEGSPEPVDAVSQSDDFADTAVGALGNDNADASELFEESELKPVAPRQSSPSPRLPSRSPSPTASSPRPDEMPGHASEAEAEVEGVESKVEKAEEPRLASPPPQPSASGAPSPAREDDADLAPTVAAASAPAGATSKKQRRKSNFFVEIIVKPKHRASSSQRAASSTPSQQAPPVVVEKPQPVDAEEEEEEEPKEDLFAEFEGQVAEQEAYMPDNDPTPLDEDEDDAIVVTPASTSAFQPEPSPPPVASTTSSRRKSQRGLVPVVEIPVPRQSLTVPLPAANAGRSGSVSPETDQEVVELRKRNELALQQQEEDAEIVAQEQELEQEGDDAHPIIDNDETRDTTQAEQTNDHPVPVVDTDGEENFGTPAVEAEPEEEPAPAPSPPSSPVRPQKRRASAIKNRLLTVKPKRAAAIVEPPSSDDEPDEPVRSTRSTKPRASSNSKIKSSIAGSTSCSRRQRSRTPTDANSAPSSDDNVPAPPTSRKRPRLSTSTARPSASTASLSRTNARGTFSTPVATNISSNGRPARNRRPTANWWDLDNALESSAAMKKGRRLVPLPKEEEEEEDEEEEEQIVVAEAPGRRMKRGREAARNVVESEEEEVEEVVVLKGKGKKKAKVVVEDSEEEEEEDPVAIVVAPAPPRRKPVKAHRDQPTALATTSNSKGKGKAVPTWAGGDSWADLRDMSLPKESAEDGFAFSD